MSVYKIKLATYLITGLGVVKTPIGLSRNKKGWWSISAKVYPDVGFMSFKDSEYGSDILSFYEAVNVLQLVANKKQLRAIETKERDCKKTKLDVVGISYCVVFDASKAKNVHVFSVSTCGFENKSSTVYIGTDGTLQQNWRDAFYKAVDIREEWVKDRIQKERWEGVYLS